MRYAIILFLTFTLGCGAKQAAKEVVPLADISPGIMEVAQKTLPTVKFESARKIKVNGEDVFEIRGKMPNGKIREVEVSMSGKVIETE